MNASQVISQLDQFAAEKARLGREVKAVDDQPGVLILGSGPLAATIVTQLQCVPRPRYRFMGCLDSLDGERSNSNGLVIGSFNRMKEILARGGVDCVVVALSERRGLLPAEELLECKTRGIRVEDGVAFYEKITGRVPLTGLNPSSLIFCDGFKRLRFTVICKRLVDVLVSCIGLIVATPMWILLPIAIKLDSEGPVLFRQERVGQYGRRFQLLKFRSMYWKAGVNGESRWAQEHDSRLTRVGRVIRKWRLDELPQLWNVLRGDMSFVGPRPDVPSLWETLEGVVPYYQLRAVVKPGITGWAQVRYRYVSSVEDGMQRHEYDLYYIKNTSLLLDLKIINETFKIVALGRGAR